MKWMSPKLTKHCAYISLRIVILTICVHFFVGINDEQDGQLFLTGD